MTLAPLGVSSLAFILYEIQEKEQNYFISILSVLHMEAALTALPVFGFGTFGHGHDLMVRKHSGLVGQLPARAAQRLTARVAVVHQSSILDKNKTNKRR